MSRTRIFHMTVTRFVLVMAACAGVALAGCQRDGRAGPSLSSSGPPQGEPGTLHPKVHVQTTTGSFVLELDAERAPITTINFLNYVNAGYYDGTVFHRVVNTMIQGGGYFPDMTEKKKGLQDPIKCEWDNGLVNRRGTIGMVRTPGIPDSARAQFYINRVDNLELETQVDGAGYAVFGQVVEGLDTIDAIGSVPVGSHPNYAAGRSAVVPRTPVVIKSVRQLTPLDWAKAQEKARLSAMTPDEMRDRLIRRAEEESGSDAVRLESGLIYVDFREGRGAMPTMEDKIEVYYRGTLVNETEFESSLDQTMTLEMSNVIEGWKQGLSTMQEGGRRILFVPPELGFGSGGVPGRVPGNAWLVFDIELVLVTR